MGAVLIYAAAAAPELAGAFANAGFMPVVATRPEHARDFAERQRFDLVVADGDLDHEARLLRELDQVDAIRVFRGDFDGSLPHCVHAALPKSIPVSEFVARVAVLVSLRGGPRNDGLLRFGPLELDVPRRSARWRGEERALTPIQFRILTLLVEKRGAVATREELQRAVWRWTPAHDGERLVAHIRRIRAKLEDDPSEPRFLLTARGEGFRLADVADGSWDGVERRRGERRRSIGSQRDRDTA